MGLKHYDLRIKTPDLARMAGIVAADATEPVLELWQVGYSEYICASSNEMAFSLRLRGQILSVIYDSDVVNPRESLYRTKLLLPFDILKDDPATAKLKEARFLRLARIIGGETIANIPPRNVPPFRPGLVDRLLGRLRN